MHYRDVWVDAQVPVGAQIFIDHTAHFVRNLDDTAIALRKLGFMPSAVNLQKNLGDDGAARPSGTSNRLVRLRRGFLEFLAATHATPLADQLNAALRRYQGLHLIAFSHSDLAAQRRRLLGSGFDMQSLIEMRRDTVIDGVPGEVRWSILRTQHGAMPEGRIQFVYPHTPELSWPKGTMDHPNAADSLTGVLVCVTDSQESWRRFGSFLDRDETSGLFVTDRGCMIVGDTAKAASLIPNFQSPDLPYIAAISILSKDLMTTQNLLSTNKVDFIEKDPGALWIGPQDALGAYLCFHDATHNPFHR